MNADLNTIEEIKRSYQVDGDGLAVIFESGMLMNMLDDFNNYQLFLAGRKKQSNSKKFIKKVSKGTNIIHGDVADTELRKIFYYAHIAACCELFDGLSLLLNYLGREAIHDLIDKSLNQLNNDTTSNQLNAVQTRVHKSDVVRTIQIVRLLGLLTSSSNEQRQLSFAAGNADREIYGIHMIPEVRYRKNTLEPTRDAIEFNKTVNQPEFLALIDNAPEFKELYEKLNTEHPHWMLAFNEDAESSISKISDLIADKKIKPFNLIAGIRIDHEIIPDVVNFFKQLAPILDSVSDLIISIGAGHTLEEFNGRINLLSTMFDFLKKKGMEPVKIVLHGEGDVEQQRATPLFGSGPTTTYEILYCKIKKKKLL